MGKTNTQNLSEYEFVIRAIKKLRKTIKDPLSADFLNPSRIS